MKKVIVSALFVMGFALSINAQNTATPVVDARQENQKDRIQDGVKNGELTKVEADRLRDQQRNIKKSEAKAKSDGVVTAGEQAKLDKKQDRASKNIAKQKHDKQERH